MLAGVILPVRRGTLVVLSVSFPLACAKASWRPPISSFSLKVCSFFIGIRFLSVRPVHASPLSLCGKIIGVAHGENIEEIDYFAILEIKVDDSSAAALSFAAGGHANLADVTTTGHWSAFFWLIGKFLLKGGIVIVAHQSRDESGKGGRFDERQHRLKV